MSVEFIHSGSSNFDPRGRSLLRHSLGTVRTSCLSCLRAGILGLVSALVCSGIVGFRHSPRLQPVMF
jgi:hypothetical protein